MRTGGGRLGFFIWNFEKTYFDGDQFFSDVVREIALAEKSVTVETYIFEFGVCFENMLKALILAAERGVDVRLMVDGIGTAIEVQAISERLAKSKVKFRVFHPVFTLPWFHLLNKRNHRKTFVIDSKTLFTGGMNVSDWHLRSVKGPAAWRDSGVQVKGDEVAMVTKAFDRAWNSQHHWWFPELTNLRLNVTLKQRYQNYKTLLEKVKKAEKFIHITNAYFVPRTRLLWALIRAARRGVDVRLLLPSISDVPVVKQASLSYYPELIFAGVRIFEYQPSVLHAKSLQIDDWAYVGSTNLNHRSFIHDLEIDIVVTKPESNRALTAKFEDDLLNSKEVTVSELGKWSLFSRVLSFFARELRYWM